MKDVFPEAPLISYCEFYYRGRGSDVGFDPEFSSGSDAVVRARARAGMHLLALEAADYAYCPTYWQKAQFPKAYQDRIEVIHDGIDTKRMKPNSDAQYELSDGTILTVDDEIITYVARNLEPYRGFHSFMRSLPLILEARPNAQVVIVGGDEVSYGSPAPNGDTWRQVLLKEVGTLPEDRVFFTGRVPKSEFLSILQVSSVHVYLTYPFVLSWSLLEAMAAGCVVVGSRTPPVQEVIQDNQNGFLTDFFDITEIAQSVGQAITVDAETRNEIRTAARETIVARYDLRTCLLRQRALIQKAVSETLSTRNA